MGFLIEKGFDQAGIRKPDYHIAGKPTGLDQLGCQARGRLWYDVRLNGRSAHGGNPGDGINTLKKAIDLAELKAKDPDFKVNGITLLNNRQTGGIGFDHEFVKIVQRITKEVTGKTVTPTGDMDGYSSLGNAYWTYTNGIAGIMYGGVEFSRAHCVDEYIEVDELVETAQVFAALAMELLCN